MKTYCYGVTTVALNQNVYSVEAENDDDALRLMRGLGDSWRDRLRELWTYDHHANGAVTIRTVYHWTEKLKANK